MTEVKRRMGWIGPSKPDHRNYTFPSLQPPTDAAAQNIDISAGDTPVYDQGVFGACTGFACKSAFEYWQKQRLAGKFTDESAMFIYKMGRDLLGLHGDSGATLKAVAQAVNKYGVCPTTLWQYNKKNLNKEPTAAVKASAKTTEATAYYQIDTRGKTPAQTLTDMLGVWTVAKLPIIAGVTIYTSYTQSETNGGCFPFPSKGEQIAGGHALEYVGHYPNMKITNTIDGSTTIGAMKVKNSWSTNWPQVLRTDVPKAPGYGFIPDKCLATGLLTDLWVITNESHVTKLTSQEVDAVFVPGGEAVANDPMVKITEDEQ